MSQKVATWAALLSLAIIVACTSQTPADSFTTSRTSDSSVASETTAPPADSTTAGSALLTAAPSSSPLSSSTPNSEQWPADLTPRQIAAAQAALAAYRAHWALIAQAYSDPSADWSTQVAQTAAGVWFDLFTASLPDLAGVLVTVLSPAAIAMECRPC